MVDGIVRASEMQDDWRKMVRSADAETVPASLVRALRARGGEAVFDFVRRRSLAHKRSSQTRLLGFTSFRLGSLRMKKK